MRHNELHPFHNSEYTRCLPKEHRCCESNNCGYLANIDNLNQTTRKPTGFRGHLEAWMEAGCTRATLVRRDCGKPLYDGKEDVHKQQREQRTRRASSTETAGKKKEKKKTCGRRYCGVMCDKEHTTGTPLRFKGNGVKSLDSFSLTWNINIFAAELVSKPSLWLPFMVLDATHTIHV